MTTTTGKVACTKCEGRGGFTYTCADCSGNGCKACRGEGEWSRYCGACEGNGEVYPEED